MTSSADSNYIGQGNDSKNQDGESKESRFDIDPLLALRILRKHKISIILSSSIVAALAAYYAFSATEIYKATSTLLIESQESSPITFEQLVGAETENAEYYQTQYELLRSRGLATRVINKLNLWDNAELAPNADAVSDSNETEETGVDSPGKVVNTILDIFKTPTIGVENSSLILDEGLVPAQQKVVGNFIGRLSIKPVRKTKLVYISYESNDPKMAALVANSVAEEYINSYLDSKVELTTKASSWLSERLSDLKKSLDESENRLINFKKANGLVDVGGSVGRLNEQELLLVTAELAQARSDLSSKRSLYRDVQSAKDSSELLENIPVVQADPLVQRVKIEQGQAQRALDELLNRYGERHPRVVDAKSQLATLKVTLEGHLARVVGSVAKDFEMAEQRVLAVQEKLNAGKNEIQDIGSKFFELDALEREVATNRSIYDTFFNRITEARSADGLEAANARISDYAIPPLNPIKPNKQLIILLATLGALVLSTLMAFIYERLDETVKETSDIEDRLGLKLLGILPLIKKGGVFKNINTFPFTSEENTGNNRTFLEAVNTVRTALFMGETKDSKRVVTVTSSLPGEGKTTSAINLAYSFAQLERVLLIDADMRRPTVSVSAGFDKNAPGLSSLISKTDSASNCIIRGVFGGVFDILPSGPIPDHPLELLSSKRFEKILEQLRVHYDRIIIDSAPTHAVSDALVLAKLSSSIVYVVKSHDTNIQLVRRGTQRLAQANAPDLGVLVSQVDIEKISSYGGDFFYQGYYDYYGYNIQRTQESDESSHEGRLRLTSDELIAICSDDSDLVLELNDDESLQKVGGRSEADMKLDFLTINNERISEISRAKVDRVNRKRKVFGNDLDIL